MLKNHSTTIIHRGVVRSAADDGLRNREVTFRPDVQGQIDNLETKQGFKNKDNLPK
jgi:hypothetical protein